MKSDEFITLSLSLPILLHGLSQLATKTEFKEQTEKILSQVLSLSASASSQEEQDLLNQLTSFLPFKTITEALSSSDLLENVVVVDCKHPKAQTITHHKGQNTPEEIKGDSSTDAVLNALHHQPSLLNKKYVSTNHFDIDSLTSVWGVVYRDKALAYEGLLRQIAKIGDFRELLDVEKTPFVHDALKICCWLNTVERNIFYRPFDGDETEGCVVKMAYFLPKLKKVMDSVEDYKENWIEEYSIVMKGVRQLADSSVTTIQKFPELGLVVVQTSEPLHYYALFSVTDGYDMVLAIYQGQKYELEYKYTTFVDLASRPSLPRVDNSVLMNKLNDLEINPGYVWDSHRINDTGPIARLDKQDAKLNKVERYGHPYQRPMYSSTISPSEFIQIVLSFFTYAYSSTSTQPKKNWSWKEVHDFNNGINWELWGK